MPIHPTFNSIPCSRPESRHAFPNRQRPTTMLHGLMDMLASNAFSISNPTPWPTIWFKPIYLCLVTKNGFLCYICAPNPTSLKARLIVMSVNNLLVTNRSYFVVAHAVPSQPSVTRVTQCLFSRSSRSFGRPSFISFNLTPYILP